MDGAPITGMKKFVQLLGEAIAEVARSNLDKCDLCVVDFVPSIGMKKFVQLFGEAIVDDIEKSRNCRPASAKSS